ncbi:MAG: BrnT family toxin [Bacteroidales bacterium]|nr:BrnT family toxin [Bacteroidales bacterium]
MFEFDKNKSESNERKHGISFEYARRLWKDTNGIEIPARWVDEPRFVLIAMLEMDIWSAVFILRKNRIRIISVRKARDNEKEIYNSSRI